MYLSNEENIRLVKRNVLFFLLLLEFRLLIFLLLLEFCLLIFLNSIIWFKWSITGGGRLPCYVSVIEIAVANHLSPLKIIPKVGRIISLRWSDELETYISHSSMQRDTQLWIYARYLKLSTPLFHMYLFLHCHVLVFVSIIICSLVLFYSWRVIFVPVTSI